MKASARRDEPQRDSRRKGRSGETRRKILDAAEQVFSHMGFVGTSTREIAKLAGVDKYAIYYHFKGKRALYEAVIERSFGRLTSFIEGLFPEEIASAADLERIFERLFRHMARHRNVMKIMQRESLDCTSAGIAESFQRYFRPLYRKGISFSEEARRRGLFRNDVNTRQFIVSLYSMIMSYYQDSAMISLLVGEDALSRRMLKERKALLAKFVMDNLAPLAKGEAGASTRMPSRRESS